MKIESFGLSIDFRLHIKASVECVYSFCPYGYKNGLMLRATTCISHWSENREIVHSGRDAELGVFYRLTLNRMLVMKLGYARFLGTRNL